jgi:MFS family permease
MTSSISKATYLIRNWYNFLMRQEEPFKINILKNFAQRFSTNLTYQYQPIYLTSLGASPLILGYLNSVNGLVNTLLAIPTGVMADRSGIKRVLTLTLIFSILSGLLFGFASSWEVGAIALVLSGVAYILDRTVCPMICGSCLATQERLTGMGICDTVSFFPQLVAPLLGATLITIFGGMKVEGIRPLFFIQGIGLIGALAIILWKFNNPISQPIGKSKNVFTDIGAIFKEGYVIKRWLFLTIVAAFPWQVMFYTPLYAAQIKGADQFILGGMSAASTIVFVFFAIPLGHLSDTVGRKKIASFASILLILSYLVLIWAPNNLVLLLSGLLSGFSMSFTQNLMAISVDLVPREYLGSWYGILGFCRGLIGIVSPLLCGYFWVFVSPSSVFYLLVFMQILALGALLLVPTRFTR